MTGHLNRRFLDTIARICLTKGIDPRTLKNYEPNEKGYLIEKMEELKRAVYVEIL